MFFFVISAVFVPPVPVGFSPAFANIVDLLSCQKLVELLTIILWKIKHDNPRSCILLVWRYTKRQEKESCKKPLDSWRRPENASPMVGKKNKHFPFSVSSFIFLYILVDHLKIRFSQVVILFLINKHNRHF